MVLNTYINYGGRFSRLCYLVPSIVHTIFLYICYYIYFNMNLFNIYILLILILFINMEWIIVIVYEYIYLTNYNIQNNLLHNMGYLIFLEILLFVGFYWLYINNIIHYPTVTPFNYYLNYNLLDNINSITNSDICLHVLMNNLLILLYVTLLLQLIHRYLLDPSVKSNLIDFISLYFSFNFIVSNISLDMLMLISFVYFSSLFSIYLYHFISSSLIHFSIFISMATSSSNYIKDFSHLFPFLSYICFPIRQPVLYTSSSTIK